jgi:hypothetical protein
MSSEIFDRNLSRLLRQAALPDEEARRTRAREEFLRSASPSSTGRSRGLAVAAAALLICAIVYAATRPSVAPAPTPSIARPAQEPASTFVDVPGFGATDFIKGTLKMSREANPDHKFRLVVQTSAPEGMVFKVTARPMTLELKWGTLTGVCKHPISTVAVNRGGEFQVEWEGRATERILIDVQAPKDDQDMTVLEKLNGAIVPSRSLLFTPYDLRWPAITEPQLLELSEFAREARDLIGRVEASSSKEERFKIEEKKLTIEAIKLHARIEGFQSASLYPASAEVLAQTIHDLEASMKNFVWKDGAFDGASSYYTPNKRGNTFRGDPFGFEALRRYIEEAVLLSGREFDLWTILEIRQRGWLPEIRSRMARLQERPGIKDFAPILNALWNARDNAKDEDQAKQLQEKLSDIATVIQEKPLVK